MRKGIATTSARRKFSDSASFPRSAWTQSSGSQAHSLIATTWTLAAAGADAEAIGAAEPALRMSRRSAPILCELAASHARLGYRAAAEAIHEEIRERARSTYSRMCGAGGDCRVGGLFD